MFGTSNVSQTIGGAGGGPTIYASGEDVFFRFGDLANADNDLDVEYVVVEYNALVENVLAVQAGGTLPNTFGVLVDLPTPGFPSSTVNTGVTATVAPNGTWATALLLPSTMTTGQWDVVATSVPCGTSASAQISIV